MKDLCLISKFISSNISGETFSCKLISNCEYGSTAFKSISFWQAAKPMTSEKRKKRFMLNNFGKSNVIDVCCLRNHEFRRNENGQCGPINFPITKIKKLLQWKQLLRS